MGTRSSTGVRIDGVDKLSYNQFDGYFGGVGQDVLDELKAYFAAHPDYDDAIGELKQKARSLEAVSLEGPAPTDQQQARFVREGAFNKDVDDGSPANWYCLLRNHQGSILKRLDAGVALVENEFIRDGLFCEYAYILNLDTEELEVYKSVGKGVKGRGRYATPKAGAGSEGWGGCSLRRCIPLRDIQKFHAITLKGFGEGLEKTDDK